MKASAEDRLQLAVIKSSKLPGIIAIILLVLTAAGIYYYLTQSAKNDQSDEFAKAISGSETNTKIPLPGIPIIEVVEPNFILPSLDESDGEFRTRLINISEELAPWLQADELIRRGIAFNDGLSRGQVSTSLLSLPSPQGKFKVDATKDGIFISPENFQRYDYIVNIVRSVDVERITHVFHLFRPLLEKAYGELGHDSANLGSALVYNLDQILATPVVDEPIELQLTSVFFTYADPELEKLRPLQKQLLRMGPEATRIIQEKAGYLREMLVSPKNDNLETTE